MRTLAIFLAAICTNVAAQDAHHGHGVPTAGAPVFQAVGTRSFDRLMADAMAVMDEGMRRAPTNGRAEHDFITMMIPHHQGAVDMAKAILLHTQDPALRNLALGIIAEQQNEINLMRAWLLHNENRKGQP